MTTENDQIEESNLEEWGEYSLEAAEEEKAILDASGRSFFTAKEGRNVLRFLPPRKGARSIFTKIHQHFIKMPGKDIRFNCPKYMAKGYCPICTKADELIASKKESDRSKGFDIRAKARYYANILDRNDEEKGVQIFGFGKTIYQALVDLRADPEDGGNFTHPHDGFDVVIERKGTGLDTEYVVRPSRKSREFGDQDLIRQQPAHDGLLIVPSLEQIRGMFEAPEEDPSEFSDGDMKSLGV